MILPQLKLTGIAEMVQLSSNINYMLHLEMIDSISKFYGAIILSSLKLYLTVTMGSLFDWLDGLLCSKDTVQNLKASLVTLKHKCKWLLI